MLFSWRSELENALALVLVRFDVLVFLLDTLAALEVSHGAAFRPDGESAQGDIVLCSVFLSVLSLALGGLRSLLLGSI